MTILIIHTYLYMWSLKLILEHFMIFFIHFFGRKELPPPGNSCLNQTLHWIGKSKEIQLESAHLCKGKVWKNHKYKHCTTAKNFSTNLGKIIHEGGKTKRSSRSWSWKRVKRIKGSIEQRGQENKRIRGAKELGGK